MNNAGVDRDTVLLLPGLPADPEPTTVDAAWALYDLEERELWNTLMADQGFLARRAYVQAERRIRRSCERTVQHIRYQQPRPAPR